MIRKLKYGFLFFCSIFMLFGSVFAQNTKNILVLPYDRFEFHTDIELSKLNEINHVTGDQLYKMMVESLSEAFELNEHQRVFYKVMTMQDKEKIRPYVKYGKIGSKSHYACNLEGLDEKVYKELMNGYDTDYLLTINWYQIIKDKTSYKKSKVKKIAIYSYHYVDVDLFSREKNRLMTISEMRFKVPATDENFEDLGCNVTDLRPQYKKLVDEITKRILAGK